MAGGSVPGPTTGAWALAVALGGTIVRDLEYCLIDWEWNLTIFCSTSWFLACKPLLGESLCIKNVSAWEIVINAVRYTFSF